MRKKKKPYRLQSQKKNPCSKYWRTKADKLWSELICRQGVCIVNNEDCCGRLEPHHLITRLHGNTRHRLENGVVLCSLHHVFSPTLSPHTGPLGFAEFLRLKYPDRYTWVQENQNLINKPDYKAAYEFLFEVKKQVGGLKVL